MRIKIIAMSYPVGRFNLPERLFPKPGSSLDEIIKEVSEKLLKPYGDKVEVGYVDFLSEDMERYPKIKELVLSGILDLPIVFIDDVLSYSGALYLPAMIEELETRMGG